MNGGDHEESYCSGSNPGADDSGTGVGPVGADVRGVTVPGVLREVDEGVAAAIDVVAKARLEREWTWEMRPPSGDTGLNR